METGGEYIGPVQLSAEAVEMDINATGKSKSKDAASNIRRNPDTFNKFIKPDNDMDWAEHAIAIHGIRPSDPRIQDAGRMRIVWEQFCNWVDSVVGDDKVAVLVAYNGETCDMKWLWKLTQAPGSVYDMPSKIKFFMDPLTILNRKNGYSSCKLHQTKSKIDSLELGVVWKYIKNENLNGAHDSLVDTKAQTDIIIHEYFVPFVDRTKSMQLITEIFQAARVRE